MFFFTLFFLVTVTTGNLVVYVLTDQGQKIFSCVLGGEKSEQKENRREKIKSVFSLFIGMCWFFLY